MIATLLALRSPAGPRARLSTLIFHRVLPAPDPLFPDEICAARFDQICGWLRQWFNVLPLDQACRQLREGTLPARALAITFDDGYADNHDVALPILCRHGLNATFFIATGFLDGGRMWNDTLVETVRRARGSVLNLASLGLQDIHTLPLETLPQRRQAIGQLIQACRYLPIEERLQVTTRIANTAGVSLPNDLMMRSDQVQAMHRAGMGIGGHTVHHPILARTTPEQARREISEGKARLEALTQSTVTLFAYPNGKPGQDFDTSHPALVRELGFEAAVTTAWGAADGATDAYRLPRFTPWDRSRFTFGLRMARNLRPHSALA